jgi:transposase
LVSEVASRWVGLHLLSSSQADFASGCFTHKGFDMKGLQVFNDRAAGVDVGSESLHTSIAGDTPQVFGTMTADLYALRDHFLAHKVQTVAMEATGIYWLCVFEVLEAAGLEVVMVNGRHVQNVPGRKTDMADCQWLSTLHAHGLLRAGFVPAEDIRRLQDYMRLRSDHISMAASHVQHMQKALDRMNIKIHEVISSLTGVSGLAMVRAIVGGERNAGVLLGLCDAQIRKTKAERIRAALQGSWREEHLFALSQALAGWDFYQAQIVQCDARIEQALRARSAHTDDTRNSPGVSGGDAILTAVPKDTNKDAAPAPKRRVSQKAVKPASPNAPRIEGLHPLVVALNGGRDASVLPGLTDYSALQLASEVGTDLARWPTAKHFTAWLGLAPGAHQSGKRRGRQARQRNRAGRVFCTVARSLANSTDKALGGFYRRIRARRGGLLANQALARKIATLYWNVMVKGLQFVEKGLAHYEQKFAQTEQRLLRKLASKHNLTLTPNPQPV